MSTRYATTRIEVKNNPHREGYGGALLRSLLKRSNTSLISLIMPGTISFKFHKAIITITIYTSKLKVIISALTTYIMARVIIDKIALLIKEKSATVRFF